MARTFHYKVIQSTWGVVVFLTAEVVPVTEFTGSKYKVVEGLWLATNTASSVGGNDYDRNLLLGLQIVAPQIKASDKGSYPIVVHVIQALYDECDFQEEGLTCAMIGWAAEEFAFSMPSIKVSFDRMYNRYNFESLSLP